MSPVLFRYIIMLFANNEIKIKKKLHSRETFNEYGDHYLCKVVGTGSECKLF